MGHDHGPPYKIPDYKSFQVKGVRQLEELQAALEKKGLKDPWIRNEVWRYNACFGTRLSRAYGLFFRGAPVGLVLAIATAFGSKALGGGDGGHGDHGEHGEQATEHH